MKASGLLNFVSDKVLPRNNSVDELVNECKNITAKICVDGHCCKVEGVKLQGNTLLIYGSEMKQAKK